MMRFSDVKTFLYEWEIRILVLTSLFLQVFLIFFGGLRKRNKSGKIQKFLWFFYLMADFIAIYALGYLSENQGKTGNLRSFWAPFLVLHLGGQDTITSFAIEDNELWPRQLLNLGSHVGLAVYVFSKSQLYGTALLIPGILMFVTGIIKYGERVWSLKSASMDSLRNSMVRALDPGPDYTKFMEVFSSSKEAGFEAEIIVNREEPGEPPDVANTDGIQEYVEHYRLVLEAHRFFQTYQRLVMNLVLSFQDRTKSQSFFQRLKWEQAYKVVEIELSLLYDILHTKAMLIGTICGRLLRFTTVLSTLTAFILFTVRDKGRYDRVDVLVTNVLFGGALGLEIYAMGLIFFSSWTYVKLDRSNYKQLARATFTIIKLFRPEERPRWSNSMAQYNLITYCLGDQPTCMNSIASFVGAKKFWGNYRNKKSTRVTDELKELIFVELNKKVKSIDQEAHLGEYRGQWALQYKGYYKEFGWSVEAEFDESILLWHIATEICFFVPKKNAVVDANSHSNFSMETFTEESRKISNYMLFLLVMQPYMLTEGIGQIRFGETCTEAKNFFQRGKKVKNAEEAAKMILHDRVPVTPLEVKGDWSRSVLHDACRLVKGLLNLTEKKRWELIGTVWVEMLCYAASKCKGDFHAKHLSMGGELLTVVWLLMAHVGIGEQYRTEGSRGRVKLIVQC